MRIFNNYLKIYKKSKYSIKYLRLKIKYFHYHILEIFNYHLLFKDGNKSDLKMK